MDKGMKITDELLFHYAAEARDIYLGTLPTSEELPTVEYSKSFHRKMQRLIKEQCRTPRMNKMLRSMKQAVAAVLAIAILTFGGLMTVDAYRAKVIEFVVHVFNELTQYRFSSDLPASDDIILPEISFGYVPDGMQEVENQITSTGQRYILYENSTGLFFELTQKAVTRDNEYGVILDTEKSDYTVGTIHHKTAYFNTKNGENTLIWIDGPVIYKLYGNIDLNELIAIAEKIKILPF